MNVKELTEKIKHYVKVIENGCDVEFIFNIQQMAYIQENMQKYFINKMKIWKTQKDDDKQISKL